MNAAVVQNVSLVVCNQERHASPMFWTVYPWFPALGDKYASDENFCERPSINCTNVMQWAYEHGYDFTAFVDESGGECLEDADLLTMMWVYGNYELYAYNHDPHVFQWIFPRIAHLHKDEGFLDVLLNSNLENAFVLVRHYGSAFSFDKACSSWAFTLLGSSKRLSMFKYMYPYMSREAITSVIDIAVRTVHLDLLTWVTDRSDAYDMVCCSRCVQLEEVSPRLIEWYGAFLRKRMLHALSR